MRPSRLSHRIAPPLLAATALLLLASGAHAQGGTAPVKYVRYAAGATTAYGILDGESVRELRGDLFGARTPTGKRLKLADVKLLAPVVPSKVIAVGLNYKSHLGERP